jgi:hypothetical protein
MASSKGAGPRLESSPRRRWQLPGRVRVSSLALAEITPCSSTLSRRLRPATGSILPRSAVASPQTRRSFRGRRRRWTGLIRVFPAPWSVPVLSGCRCPRAAACIAETVEPEPALVAPSDRWPLPAHASPAGQLVNGKQKGVRRPPTIDGVPGGCVSLEKRRSPLAPS